MRLHHSRAPARLHDRIRCVGGCESVLDVALLRLRVPAPAAMRLHHSRAPARLHDRIRCDGGCDKAFPLPFSLFIRSLLHCFKKVG
ncbi:hypothetical protein GM415_10305 [Pseudodesulfovibrio cashew]|uniref:Uncharacterized protein n=1 Tax=Pseudodesulfovibrio cashew TaxID=2678688 RepID=A0A6I6JH62_9BACT|nr:hypothetical protein GM415_10305 [Pseudodesulfovibrio cashew]